MVDYKTFKKGYLTEWVDRSQAARKAAEELAKKELGPSLRDKYRIIMTLNGKQVEFKSENEEKRDGDIYFTYDEAMERFGKPDEYGWRLPTKEELETLKNDYSYEFDKVSGQGVFDNHLALPATGFCYCGGDVANVGFSGRYWSSTPNPKIPDNAWYLYFYSGGVVVYFTFRSHSQSVRLVRDVK